MNWSFFIPTIRYLCIAGALLVAAATTLQQVHAAESPCKPVYDALAKLAATPNHLYMHSAAAFGNKASDGEVITTTKAIYVSTGSAWHSRPYDAAQSVRELQKAGSRPHETCERVGKESIAGEEATRYRTHDRQNEGTAIDTQMWISASRGLPLRQVIDMDGGGKMGKSHDDIRFDYANVTPPASAK